ncbi:GTP pyrophosphokinase [Dethiosulfatibacter aminovorans DSM 17477]|uniref:GTP diphosphokinase n=1 Tax=Dethiosulfatibacter aminovorans DSM 17477 TaxID=1121476 RepID=A0A1M6D482_9FIRM|nr:bifunctional (p)ppGpp synthetase/guanosine-3',5'-bis(diphosphate) 3'-pyrophosphohydrolase [Dethiosulfatibacter aminovorans]SHI68057.1 GTP pyrophosphokinase [Dethiosulfatibacter aminovorans DSM 17477]
MEKLIKNILEYNPKADIELIKKAYNYSKKLHDDAPLRLSGEAFFIHPYLVATILTELNMDVDTIAAGLLHDTIEDTIATYDDIKNEFSEDIANLVDGVTKLSKVKYKSKEERQAESLRKMVIAMSKDIRVIIIKLADRLHNLRTLEYMSVEKQKEKAMETLEIYAPIANRLGMASIKWELEDLSLKYIDPEGFEDVRKRIKEKRKDREEYIESIMNILREKIEEAHIEFELSGRPKSIYSIYKKMYHKNKIFEEIYDITAIRIIVHSVKDCYGVLGVAHTLWKPLPGRFKDYIAMPKPNMYQSLHTTVIGPNGEPFEIQIRTLEMHKTAEYGIAAHWKYKEGIKTDNFEDKLNWLRHMLDWQKDTNDPREFMESLKIDLYTDEVFVFTPNGDVINLPIGSTPIDFAYRVHSAVGNKCIGAKVNGRIVPLDYKLKNGNQVEIITSASSNGPSRDWLKIVKSSQARSKIRKYFKDKERGTDIEHGKDAIEKEVKKQGFKLTELLKEKWLLEVVEKMNLKTLDNLYAAVGHRTITELQVVMKLITKYKAVNKDKFEEKIKEVETVRKSKAPTSGVIIKGLDNIKVRFSKCCSPVPGDEIVGYITRGRGVSVHRADCTNISAADKDARFIEVEWDNSKSISFTAELQIEAVDRPGLLQDITGAYTEFKVNATHLNLRVNKDKIAVMNITFEIKESRELNDLIKKFKRIDGVIDVYRYKK